MSGCTQNIAVTVAAAPGACPTGSWFELTLTNYVMPEIGANLVVEVCSSAAFVEGQYVWISGFGWFEVDSLVDGTHLSLVNTGADANEPPGTSIPEGTPMVPDAPPYPGISSFRLSALVEADFTVPAVGADITVTVDDTRWALVNMTVWVENAGYFQIISKTSSNLTIRNLGSIENAAPTTNVIAPLMIYPETPSQLPPVDGVTIQYNGSGQLESLVAGTGHDPDLVTIGLSGGGLLQLISIPADLVDNTDLANMAALTVKCNPTNAAADPSDLGGAAANEVLKVNAAGGALVFEGIPVTGLIGLDGSNRAEIPDPSCVAGKFGPLKIGTVTVIPSGGGAEFNAIGPVTRCRWVTATFNTSGVGHINGVLLHISGSGAFAGEEILIDQAQMTGVASTDAFTVNGPCPAGHYFKLTSNTGGSWVTPAFTSGYYYELG